MGFAAIRILKAYIYNFPESEQEIRFSYDKGHMTCADPESFLGGGEKNLIPLSAAIIGPPAKRHLNCVSLAADDCPTLNAGLVAL